MRFLFIVQGEGRGHMTQAISLLEYLKSDGHELTAVALGSSKRREIPDFVQNAFDCPLHTFESPNFITDKKGKTIRLSRTIIHNFLRANTFYNSLIEINTLVKVYRPDIILNFYDVLGGLYNLLFRPKCRFWVIGHQYLIGHQDFPFAKSKGIQKLLFILNTKITAFGADKELALSFRPMEPPLRKSLFVLPPLLRKELKELCSKKGDYYLSYVVNSGYGEEIIATATKNPEINIVAFWDKKEACNPYQPLPNLIFHKINNRLFLEKMASCKGLVCSAGFESICEAMFLGKPVMVIPVKGQYEQSCNALDAEISGAGIHHHEFDFSIFDEYLLKKKLPVHDPQAWANSFYATFQNLLHAENQAVNTFPLPSIQENRMISS